MIIGDGEKKNLRTSGVIVQSVLPLRKTSTLSSRKSPRPDSGTAVNWLFLPLPLSLYSRMPRNVKLLSFAQRRNWIDSDS